MLLSIVPIKPSVVAAVFEGAGIGASSTRQMFIAPDVSPASKTTTTRFSGQKRKQALQRDKACSHTKLGGETDSHPGRLNWN